MSLFVVCITNLFIYIFGSWHHVVSHDKYTTVCVYTYVYMYTCICYQWIVQVFLKLKNAKSLICDLLQNSEDIRCKCICPPYRDIEGQIYKQNVSLKDWYA